jgi:hypothetical protein
MKAACVLPAPDGLTEDLMNKAVYELNKLGRITDSPITGEGAVEVFIVPWQMNPDGASKEMLFLRFVANLVPSLGGPNV